MRLIGQAHTLVHQNGVVRIQSDIRIGTRYVMIKNIEICKNDSSQEQIRNSYSLIKWPRLRAYLLATRRNRMIDITHINQCVN